MPNTRIVFSASTALHAAIKKAADRDRRTVSAFLSVHLEEFLGVPREQPVAEQATTIVDHATPVAEQATTVVEPALQYPQGKSLLAKVNKGRFLKPAESAGSSTRLDGSPWADNGIEFREHLRGTDWNKLPYAELASSQRQRANAEDDERHQASAT
jgi:hypothetical protein